MFLPCSSAVCIGRAVKSEGPECVDFLLLTQKWMIQNIILYSLCVWLGSRKRLVSECYANPLEDKPLKLVCYWGGRVVKHGHPSLTFGNNNVKGLRSMVHQLAFRGHNHSSHQGINGRLGKWRQGWHMRPSLNRDMSCNLPYIKNQVHYLS